MRLLLDTHTFLWFIAADPALSLPARRLLEDSRHTRLVSVVSLWEIAIKSSIGKLELKRTIPDLVAHDVVGNGFDLLPIDPAHLAVVQGLPFHHRDLFDRLLVAQATAEAIPLVSRDAAVEAYGVSRLW